MEYTKEDIKERKKKKKKKKKEKEKENKEKEKKKKKKEKDKEKEKASEIFGKKILSNDSAIKKFEKKFPNYDKNGLKFVYNKTINDDFIEIVYSTNKQFFIFSGELDEDDNDIFDRYCDWDIVNKIEFDGSNLMLMDNSSKYIKYDFYPFEQGNELPLSGLGMPKKSLTEIEITCDLYDIKKKFENQSEFFESDDDIFISDTEISWKDDIHVHIGDINLSIVYIVAKDNKIISGFYDKQTTFQLGDCITRCYLHNDNLVIQNCGDVSSVVIIKK